MENKKKKSSFGLFLIAYVLFFVFIAIVAVRYFYPIFLEYETNLPKNIAEEYVRSFNEDKVRALTADFVASLDSGIETPEESFQQLNELFKEGITCRRISSEAKDNSCVYALLSSGKKIGSIRLETQDPKRGGFAEWINPRHWYVSEEKTEDFSVLIQTESVIVPENATVVFGNKTLGAEDMSGEKTDVSAFKKLYASYPSLPRLVTYTVTGYLAPHEFSFFDESGASVNLDGTAETAEEYVTDNCTEAEKEALETFCKDFIDRFTAFNANGGRGYFYNLDYLRELLVPDTTYYNNLALAKEMISYTRPHGYSVDGLTMNSTIRLDKNHLLAGFSYLYSEAEDDGSRKQAASDVTLFIVQSENGLLVESCLTGPAVAVN